MRQVFERYKNKEEIGGDKKVVLHNELQRGEAEAAEPGVFQRPAFTALRGSAAKRPQTAAQESKLKHQPNTTVPTRESQCLITDQDRICSQKSIFQQSHFQGYHRQ